MFARHRANHLNLDRCALVSLLVLTEQLTYIYQLAKKESPLKYELREPAQETNTGTTAIG